MSHVKLAPCLFSVNSSCKGEETINLGEKTREQQDAFLGKWLMLKDTIPAYEQKDVTANKQFGYYMYSNM